MIPSVNLDRQIESLREDIDQAIGEVIDKKAFISGPFANKFAEEFAHAHQIPYAISCSNGTAALSLALEAAGIGSGDEVITVANTFIATAEAICHVGATPVFVDIRPDDYNIDPEKIEPAITDKTRAIIPVHLYGTPCRMDEILTIAEKYKLAIIEDCAQAHLAQYQGQSVGSFGEAGTFSFYPGKNLGAFGDAGAVITTKENIATHIKKLLDHGRLSKYEHDMVGYNHRMDGIQAAILSTKLPHLSSWTKRRQHIAAFYDSQLIKAGFKVITAPKDATPVYHLYVVEVTNRDDVINNMKESDIQCGIHYPVPLHQQLAFKGSAKISENLLATEQVAPRIMSLPICGGISDEEVIKVVKIFLAIAKP